MPPATPVEPTPDVLGGPGLAAGARRCLLATRPQFLTASVLPVLVGTGWGYQAAGRLDALAFALALAATVLVHAGANVLNDVYDDIGGSDRINDARMYPFTGGSRFIQNQVLSRAQMARLGSLLIAGALIAGLLLALHAGPGVVALGLTGVALGVLYSMPPVALVSRGLGELTVAIAFGPLPVAGAAWLQGAAITVELWLVSFPVACLVAAILLVNEVPDATADASVGKRTLPVRAGPAATRWVYVALQASAAAAFAVLALRGVLPALSVVVPAVLATAAMLRARGIAPGADRAALERAIAITPPVHALACAWLAGWLWFAAWVG